MCFSQLTVTLSSKIFRLFVVLCRCKKCGLCSAEGVQSTDIGFVYNRSYHGDLKGVNKA